MALRGAGDTVPPSHIFGRDARHPQGRQAGEHAFRQPAVGTGRLEIPQAAAAVGSHEHFLKQHERCSLRSDGAAQGGEQRRGDVVAERAGRGRPNIEYRQSTEGDCVEPLSCDTAARSDKPDRRPLLLFDRSDDRLHDSRATTGGNGGGRVLTHRSIVSGNPLLDRHPLLRHGSNSL